MVFIAQCLHPLAAYRSKNGEIVFLGREGFEEYQKSGKLHSFSDDTSKMIFKNHGMVDIFYIPCGRCINCRLNYARKWSQRCLLESKCWDDNWFVTLTYDDDCLSPVFCEDTGEVIGSTLVPSDVTDFLKRLRSYYSDNFDHVGVRYYYCGEYGDHTFRPHYHLLLFNLPLNDLTVYSKSVLGDIYYNSQSLSRLWGKGHVVVGELTAQSAAYTARYVQKKATKKDDLTGTGFHKEFVRMSRRPGIALPYFEKNVGKIYENDLIYLPNGQTCHPMRYFDDKAAQYGVDIEGVKKRRLEVSNMINDEKVDQVGREFYEYLDDLENEFLKKSRSLIRNKC